MNRQEWDEAGLIAGVTVPWPTGGDLCSESYGVRVLRLSLLMGVDCASGRPVWCEPAFLRFGAFDSDDIVRAMANAWISAGRAPAEVVVPRGLWQSRPVLRFLGRVRVRVVSPRGVPQPKRVESTSIRLRKALALLLPEKGREFGFRGDMTMRRMRLAECAAQTGRRSPRGTFPDFDEFKDAVRRAVALVNEEPIDERKEARG